MKLSCITSIVALLGLGSLATADIFRVDPEGQGDYLTINEAVDDVPDGSTIEISAGTYEENILLNDRDLTIRGTGVVNIQGCWDCHETRFRPVMHIAWGSNVTLDNINVTSQSDGHCGLWLEEVESATILNCNFSHNLIFGIRVSGQCGHIELTDSDIRENSGTGLWIDDEMVGTTVVSGCVIADNVAPNLGVEHFKYCGGGIRAEGSSDHETGASLHISDTTCIRNTTFLNGGGLFIGPGMEFVTINQCGFIDNQCRHPFSLGAAIGVSSKNIYRAHANSPDHSFSLRVKVDNTEFKRNRGSATGAIFLADLVDGTVKFTACTFENNESATYGGAVVMMGLAESNISFIACMFKRNSAQIGGAFYIRDSGSNLNVLIDKSELRSNLVTYSRPREGASIRNMDPFQVHVRNSTICDGYAPIVGGWVDDNNVYQTDCTFQSCCLSGHCSDKPEMECLEHGGTWHGNMSCDEVVCDPIEGACCLGSWCATMTESECDQHNGVYQGNGSKCEPGYTCEPRNPADFDLNGKVDVDDLMKFFDYWGK
ncbi:MAG: right-handed parallel beta-helix repeat-containing protein [Planctomycetota bacterium]|nr:right-handed parallel beta-helix repeat-containing protein [Planctomycetota bacterium]